MMKTTKTSHNRYALTLKSGEKIYVKAIPRDGYRSVSTVEEFPEQPPVPSQVNWFDYIEDWVVDEDDEDPLYLEAMELYDSYINQLLANTQYETTLYVIDNGLVDNPTKLETEYYFREENATDDSEVKLLWLLDKCANEAEFLDIIDAIVGINMPTESGVRSVIQSFQTMIVDNDVMVPLLNWESEKERKGGVMMSLYAEGLLACMQLNGIITLSGYFNLPGDPRYIDEDSDLPLSMSHIIAMNRSSNTSEGAVQEIEMRDTKSNDDDGEEWLRKGRHKET